MIEITAHNDGVHVRGTVGVDGRGAPREKCGLDQAIERHQPQQATAQLLHRECGRQQHPVREPSGGWRHGCSSVGHRHGGRNLTGGLHHQRDGRIGGIREPEQVTENHREERARDQEHASAADEAEEQFQAAHAAPGLGPGEQAVPRFGGVA